MAGRDSSVGIETSYGLDGPEIDPWWGEIFRIRPTRPWGPPSILYNEYRVFSGVKAPRGVALTTYPYLAPRLKEE